MGIFRLTTSVRKTKMFLDPFDSKKTVLIKTRTLWFLFVPLISIDDKSD